MTSGRRGVQFRRFTDTVIEPLICAAGEHPLTIYGIGEEGNNYAMALGTCIGGFYRKDADAVRLAIETDEIQGIDDMKIAGKKKLVNRRYQIIVVAEQSDHESAYRVGKRLREIEDETGARAVGISAASGNPPSHIKFHELTRQRLSNGITRGPLTEEKTVYGADARAYVDRYIGGLLPRLDDEMQVCIDVVERPGQENAAQYLAHVLYEKGLRVRIVDEDELNARNPSHGMAVPDAMKIVIPGSRDPDFIDRYHEVVSRSGVEWLEIV